MGLYQVVKASDLGGIPDPKSKNFGRKVKEFLEVAAGYRGDPDDRFVTVKDLYNSNFVTYLSSQPVSVTKPDQAFRTDAAAPPPPRNLQVASSGDADHVSALANHLTWEVPADNGELENDLSHTEIWYSTTTDRTDAVLLGVVTYDGQEFVHSNPKPDTDHYYWVRMVDWAGQYSAWEPTAQQGGLLVSGDDSITESVDALINALKGEDPTTYNAGTTYGLNDVVKYVCADGATRRYQSQQASNTGNTPEGDDGTWWVRVGIIVDGEIDGTATVGIDGNLVVDGTILAHHIKANEIDGTHITASATITLSDGGSLTAGNDEVKILTSDGGYIEVAPDGGTTGNDYLQLTSGTFVFWYYDSVNDEHVSYASLKRIETGFADNGEITTLPGIWKSAPVIMLMPYKVPCYDQSNNGQDQSMEFIVSDVRRQTTGSNLTTNPEMDSDTYWDKDGTNWVYYAANDYYKPDNVSGNGDSALTGSLSLTTNKTYRVVVTLGEGSQGARKVTVGSSGNYVLDTGYLDGRLGGTYYYDFTWGGVGTEQVQIWCQDGGASTWDGDVRACYVYETDPVRWEFTPTARLTQETATASVVVEDDSGQQQSSSSTFNYTYPTAGNEYDLTTNYGSGLVYVTPGVAVKGCWIDYDNRSNNYADHYSIVGRVITQLKVNGSWKDYWDGNWYDIGKDFWTYITPKFECPDHVAALFTDMRFKFEMLEVSSEKVWQYYDSAWPTFNDDEYKVKIHVHGWLEESSLTSVYMTGSIGWIAIGK